MVQKLGGREETKVPMCCLKPVGHAVQPQHHIPLKFDELMIL